MRPERADLRRSLAAALLLLVVLLLRYHDCFERGVELPDEIHYITAFDAIRRGSDPYASVGFVYPYPFAVLGASVAHAIGLGPTLIAMRALNALGTVATVALAVSFIERRWLALVVGALVVIFAPSVWQGVEMGNVSGLAIGLGLVGIASHRRRPVLAGALLGASLVLKPILLSAAAALAGFAVARLRSSDRRAAVASVVAAISVVAALCVRPSLLSSMIHVRGEPVGAGMISAYRGFYLLGLPVPATLFVVIGAVAAFAIATRIENEDTLLLFAATVSALSVPYLWKHTLLVILPVQVCAFVVADRSRERARDASERQRATLRIALLALANALLLVSEALPLSSWIHASPRAQGVVVLLLYCIPLVLFVSTARQVDFAVNRR